MFALAGAKYDKAAAKQGKEYRFIFVRADGKQLRKITQIVEKNQIMPAVDPHVFSLERADQALKLVADGGSVGKVLIQI